MNPRDFLTSAAIGLVVLVGGLAIVDSVRGCDRSNGEVAPPPAEAPTTSPTTTESNGLDGRPDAPEGWPEGTLDGVLTFVDADTCRLRAIGLSGGRERPLRPYQTECGGFWAPPIGARVAYETFSPALGMRALRIADLGHGDRDFGEYSLPDGEVLWSFDGQRLAWCDSPRTGVEREVLGGERSLGFCPLAYTPEGELAHAVGQRLVVGGETVMPAFGRIRYAQFGIDGSVAIVPSSGWIDVLKEGTPGARVEIPGDWTGESPAFSPDMCFAAVPLATGIRVLPLCAGGTTYGFPGHAAAWSPDGEWIAVTDTDGIFFYEMGAGEILHWPATAVRLSWRPS